MPKKAAGSGPENPRSWFAVADLIGERLVPDRADWVLVHIREDVLAVMRSGQPGSLKDAGIGAPADGEALSIVTLRHSDGEAEAALHHLVNTLAPRVGDPYGSGRVTATGVTRVASNVDPAHLRAIARTEADVEVLAGLNLGSAVIAPVVSDGIVLGALNLVHARTSAVADTDRELAEDLGRRIGAALDASRPSTAEADAPPRAAAELGFVPGAEANPVAAARSWARRSLPELLDVPARVDLADDLDLVLSELVGNAVRHAGGLVSISLGRHDDVIRAGVRDVDDRSPVVRPVSDPVEVDFAESGRGMQLVTALADAWGTSHHLPEPGKTVWAELPIRD